MRLHALSMTAFGPYAETATLDFDALNDAGVFLLTGPTGAGKTTILDAVCYALYGVVPGVREVRTLRSDHAADGVRPEVVLEVTLGDRRYRVHRSPEWHRPKRRGHGTTREPARASLVEVGKGEERLVSARAAEVGQTLGSALGMTSDQFMQVVLLPQGEFQRFLRASSDERQEVLQRLFRTQRFEHIEDWVRDHSRELAARAQSAERRVAELLVALSRRSGVAVPPELCDDRVTGEAGALGRWAAGLVSAARELASDAGRRELEAQRRSADAEATLTRTRACRDLADRRDAARAELDVLAATADETRGAASLLRDLERAAQVRPYLAHLGTARATADELRSRVSRLAATVADRLPEEVRAELLGDPTDAVAHTLRRTGARLVAEAARLRAALPRETERRRLEVEIGAAAQERATAEAGLEEVTGRLARLPDRLEAVERQLADARTLAATVDRAGAEAASARERLDAVRALPRAEAEHRALLEQAAGARDHAADARELLLDVVARRLAGMAAELAGGLGDGLPCPVCGGCEHPRPAVADADRVTEEDQERAQRGYDRQRSTAETLAVQVEASRGALTALVERAGGVDEAAAAAALAGAEQAAQRAREAAAEVPGLEAAHAAVHRDRTELTDRARALEGRGGAALARLEALDQARAQVQAELEQVTGGRLAGVADLLRDTTRAVKAVDSVAETVESCRAAVEAERSAHGEAAAAAHRHGFATMEEAAAALAREAESARLRELLDQRRRRSDAAHAVLAEPAVQELPEAVDVDLGDAESTAAAAREELAQAIRSAGSAAESAGALEALRLELEEALAAWEPTRRRHRTADDVSRLLRGTGSDNQLQMRLSSYVLATRLDQVLDAANERLEQMRDHRYSLHRCATARGGSRAGLGIEVLDAWTGDRRAPSTLSGGETFVVSLSLALGLADVVGHEAGGLRVDTLFVDEGFGMLDPETLDDVMDRIDALRAGGRTVGVVSHVGELRARIPTQVHVTRGRRGSTVTVRTLVA